MAKAIIIENQAVELIPGQPFVDANGLQHPGNWVQCWTNADYVAHGVYTVIEPAPAPEGKVITSTQLVIQNGVPVRLAIYNNTPAPERRLIPKSVIQERVNALAGDKMQAILALLLMPENAIYFARWFATDWPNVYFDDPQMLFMLQSVGCDAAEIAAVTAPYH